MSSSLLLPNLYQSPRWATNAGELQPDQVTDEQEQEALEDFYVEMFEELAKFGDIENIYVCENTCDHLIGNVYVKYYDDESASKGCVGLTGRFFAGRPLAPEFSPVTDFREGSCRQHDSKQCTRGGFCNFMHLAHVPPALHVECRKEFNQSGHRSPTPDRHDRRRRSRSRDRDRDRDRNRDRNRDRERGDRERGRSRRSRSKSRSRDRKRDRKRDR